MGATDLSHYDSTQRSVSLIMKALAHPARIKIAEYLMKVNTCNATEIHSIIPLSQPTIAQHLHKLVLSGVLEPYFFQNMVYYTLNLDRISYIRNYAEDNFLNAELNNEVPEKVRVKRKSMIKIKK